MQRSVVAALSLFSLLASPVVAQDAEGAADKGANQPPEHIEPFPNLAIGSSRKKAQASFELSPHLQRAVPAKEMLKQQRRLNRSLDALQRERSGTIDAYVVSVALDSDPVFAREAREAGKVLSRRYGGEGRTLVLAGPDGARDDQAQGSIRSLLLSLARIAELMNTEEDVLVLYTTSHGAKVGLINHYGDTEYGVLSPKRLAEVFEELGIERRLLIISACYSGVFIPELASTETAILTAAAAQRTSFGCEPDNDWTFYGDAMINRALRRPQPLAEAAKDASRKVAQWESKRRLLASLPQSSIGSDADVWLSQLEGRMPQTATQPVGRSSAE
ncbi:C13 family peptidase [Erythrobacter sp. F6033]|uniref:C13 family peptidase n=1 Tax=Erythrobacter sp. F6033 TaxID=2926401 RepID=UPI001FF44F9E|nr:C13 family peptidase [Erythrobacter sp. F6033]MCK0128195.1 C13 family peptidase [Erythrobacter sp. F6033]